MKNQRILKKRPKKEIKQTPNTCPDCKSSNFNLDHSRGEITCKNCGLVIKDFIIDDGPEWRAFDHEQQLSRTRVGAPLSPRIHDYGLATDIDWKNDNISSKNMSKYYRMRKWNKKIRVSGSRERNLAFALTQIDRKCSNLALHKVVRESAAQIYRNALNKKLIRGRTIEGIISATIYIACRQCKIPRTLSEIACESSSTKKEIARTYRFLARELKIKLTPTSPKDYIPRFASELRISEQSQVKAIKIIEQSGSAGLHSGKGPNGIAAAALYISSLMENDRKSQKDIAEVAGITEVTLRNRYKELSENLNLTMV